MNTSIVLTGILKVTKDSELLDDYIKSKLENI